MSTQSDPLKVTTQELHLPHVCYKALVVAGCSFSTGDSNLSVARTRPMTWSHYFLKEAEQFTQYVNLAMSGGGNGAMSANVINFLESNKSYSHLNTLVLFNITGLGRLDFMCDKDHPDRNHTFSWAHVVDHDWITSGGMSSKISWLNVLIKNMGFDSIQRMSAINIVQMISYLEIKRFTYGFMLMNNDIDNDMPSWLHTWLAERRSHKINLDGQNMHEFCRAKDSLDKDQFHPNQFGHELIANAVVSHCRCNGII